MEESKVERSKCLVRCGWLLAITMYIVQAFVFIKFLDEHSTTGIKFYWIGAAIYLGFAIVVLVILCMSKGYAETGKQIWFVWAFWFIYILLYAISVAIVFVEVSHKLTKSETYGPNLLKSTLRIAPALRVLVLQIVITPAFRKDVLSLSLVAALNLFDGIEMLEIVLMQNEREDFDLDESVKISIVAFACFSFLITSLGLARNKFDKDQETEEREERKERNGLCLGLSEIFLTNVPFLSLRIYVWADCGYEASIFIAKNVISLVIGLVNFCIARECFPCQ